MFLKTLKFLNLFSNVYFPTHISKCVLEKQELFFKYYFSNYFKRFLKDF